jgi:hypothetical protein
MLPFVRNVAALPSSVPDVHVSKPRENSPSTVWVRHVRQHCRTMATPQSIAPTSGDFPYNKSAYPKCIADQLSTKDLLLRVFTTSLPIRIAVDRSR